MNLLFYKEDQQALCQWLNHIYKLHYFQHQRKSSLLLKMKTLNLITNLCKENYLEKMSQFLNSALILKIFLDPHFLTLNNLLFSFLLPLKKSQKKINAKFLNLLSKFLMLLAYKMIFILIYLTGAHRMKQESGLIKLFLFGMQKRAAFLGFVKMFLHLEMTKKMFLQMDHNHLFTLV